MTRVIVYSAALIAFVAAAAMTFATLNLPLWISYTATPSISRNYGLHKICQYIDLSIHSSSYDLSTAISSTFTTTTLSPSLPASSIVSTLDHGNCRPFPLSQDCPAEEQSFCTLWRTIGWLMNFTAVLQLVTIVTFIVVLAGGKQKREHGWRVIVIMMIVGVVTQVAASSIVSYLFDHDSKFNVPGFRLGEAWVLSTVSWVATFLTAGFLGVSPILFKKEDGYDFIRD